MQNGTIFKEIIGFRTKILEHKYTFSLVLAFIIYFVVWTNISLYRLDSLNVLWADLGIAMERGWLMFNNSWNFSSYLYVFFNSAIVFIFAPITLLHNFTFILTLQTALIGAACFPIFGISKYLTKDVRISLLLSLIYLIYFPISGLNWYDFHFQALFPFLFLTGYYFYLKERRVVSISFLFLSATVRFPYASFTLLLGITIIAQILYNRIRERSSDLSGIAFPITLIVLSVFLLLGAYLVNGSSSYVSATVGYGNQIFEAPLVGFETFLWVFIPLGFIPFFSKHWFIFYLPYLVLLVAIGGYAKVIPNAFHYQYTAMIIPFVFLGFIDVFKEFSRKNNIRSVKKLRKILLKQKKIVLIVVAVLAIFTASLFEPYSPINKYTFDNFNHFGHYEARPTDTLAHLNKVLKFIPKDNNTVLTQFDIPEIYPRAPAIPSSSNVIYALIASHSILYELTNITVSNIRNNSYNVVIYPNDKLTRLDLHIYYALAYTNSLWYSNNYPNSMQNIVHLMNQSGNYGVVADYYGFLLLKWKYTGPVLLSTPKA